jgi:hypothetical protein
MDLKIIERDLQQLKPLLAKAADIILTEDVSRYPIFILNKEDINIGISVFERDKAQGLDWNINASTLEEFYVKKMIEVDKIDDFKKTYQSPETHLCILAVEDAQANFIFLTR